MSGRAKAAPSSALYCREWGPLNPAVNRVVFRLMDEIIEAFRADALHVGMDEVFLLGSEHSPSTKGKTLLSCSPKRSTTCTVT